MKEILSYNRANVLDYYHQLSSEDKLQVNLSMPPFAGVIKNYYYKSYCDGTDRVHLALSDVTLPQDSLKKIAVCISETQPTL